MTPIEFALVVGALAVIAVLSFIPLIDAIIHTRNRQRVKPESRDGDAR